MIDRRLAVLALLCSTLVGCDLFGPSGPGTLEATIETPTPLGALVLELDGPGITGFEGRGSTRVHAHALPDGTRHRVVLVGPGGDPLRFAILVEDQGAEGPTVTVVSSVDPNNQPVRGTGIQVRAD